MKSSKHNPPSLYCEICLSWSKEQILIDTSRQFRAHSMLIVQNIYKINIMEFDKHHINNFDGPK